MSTCSFIPSKIRKCIQKSVDDLTFNMTEPNMDHRFVCIKPDVSYERFYDNLKGLVEEEINHIVKGHNICDVDSGRQLYQTYQKIMQQGGAPIETVVQSVISKMDQDASDDIDHLTFDFLTATKEDPFFHMDIDIVKTINSFMKVMFENCHCHFHEMFTSVLEKYLNKYRSRFQGKTKEDVVQILRDDFQYVKDVIVDAFQKENIEDHKEKVMNNMSNNLTGLYNFSVEPVVEDKSSPKVFPSRVEPVVENKSSPKVFPYRVEPVVENKSSRVEDELQKLIPNDLGSMKDFFIKLIATYYNNLHPIIWSQIISQMIDQLFIDLPASRDELFQFVSKYTLLNSGPFILKILQMIRPILSPELRTKYNLTKLKYPLLSNENVNMILKKVVNNWDLYKISGNHSASVGHVVIAYRVDNPEDTIVIKIIKPISIAQSCWEYKILMGIDLQPCEKDFVKNLLESNGKEMNVIHEANNIKLAHQYYTDTYQNVFGVNIDAKITTIEVYEGIIDPSCWFAVPMTLAPGVPLSYLVERDELKTDTKYRARLHRCLDLFVYKFFYNLVQNGFYHGDPHAGNIFFSYQHGQLTLIDFGAVGELNIYENSESTKALLEIIIMSLYYNFDGLFDRMTELLNSKCQETTIDMNSIAYKSFKTELYKYKTKNILNADRSAKQGSIFKKDLFSDVRIESEMKGGNFNGSAIKISPFQGDNTIYSYLEKMPPTPETVIENDKTLPEFTQITDNQLMVSFPQVLEKILKFYATSGINVPIKMSEFYEFQKAYALLLGVLSSVGYHSYRSGIAIKQAIVNFKNLNKITELGTVTHAISVYSRESSEYKQLRNTLCPMSKPLVQHQEGGSISHGHKKYKTKYLNLLETSGVGKNPELKNKFKEYLRKKYL